MNLQASDTYVNAICFAKAALPALRLQKIIMAVSLERRRGTIKHTKRLHNFLKIFLSSRRESREDSVRQREKGKWRRGADNVQHPLSDDNKPKMFGEKCLK